MSRIEILKLASSKTNFTQARPRGSAALGQSSSRSMARGSADRLSARARLRQLELLQPPARSLRGFRCIRTRSAGAGDPPRPCQDHDGVVSWGCARDPEDRRRGAGASRRAHSMGTLVALHVAAAVPDAVLSLATLFGRSCYGDAARERLRERACPSGTDDRRRRRRCCGQLGSTATKSINPIAPACSRRPTGAKTQRVSPGPQQSRPWRPPRARPPPPAWPRHAS